MKKYKILLSAYACEPNRGSEPGVGWNWAIELAKLGHEVWVITRGNNKNNINTENDLLESLPNLHFVYYDFPYFLRFWKKGVLGVHIYYFLWQIGIVKIAKKLDLKINFDLVHHITFVSFHHPSFLYKLNKTFIYGPIAGGEKTPKQLYGSFPMKYRLVENFKLLYNKLKYFDFFQQQAFKKASLIFVTSKDSKMVIPKKYHHKVKIQLAIGIDNVINKSSKVKNDKFKVMFVGRFIYWKGIQLALKAFSKLKNKNIEFLIVGKGKYVRNLKKIQYQYNLKNIIWKEWMPQNELFNEIKNSDCFLFPSYHDSGGMVVLEAMSRGVPVIALDLGGPGEIVTNKSGRLIKTKDKNQERIISELADSILEISNSSDLLNSLSKGALKRSKEFRWKKIVLNTYNVIYKEINK